MFPVLPGRDAVLTPDIRKPDAIARRRGTAYFFGQHSPVQSTSWGEKVRCPFLKERLALEIVAKLLYV
jgi:hypothetical protein